MDYLTLYSVVTANVDAEDEEGNEIQYYRTELRRFTKDLIEKNGDKYTIENWGDEIVGTVSEIHQMVEDGELEFEMDDVEEETYVVNGKRDKEFDDDDYEVTDIKWYGEYFYKDLESAKKEFEIEISKNESNN